MGKLTVEGSQELTRYKSRNPALAVKVDLT